MRYLAALALVLALGALGRPTPEVRADYPVAGSVSAGVSDATPAPGSAVTVSCTVLGANGAPLAGQPCTFSIVSAPAGTSFGGSQSVVASSDNSGVATAVLSTSATPGVIIVRMESGGVSSQITINTGGPQELPPTGGTSDGAGRWLLPGLLIAGLVLLAGGLLLAFNRRRA